RLRGAIKRPAAAERKPERALCPIHTMVRSKAVEQPHLRLTDFHAGPAPTLMGTGEVAPPAEPYGAFRGLITGRLVAVGLAVFVAHQVRSERDRSAPPVQR